MKILKDAALVIGAAALIVVTYGAATGVVAGTTVGVGAATAVTSAAATVATATGISAGLAASLITGAAVVGGVGLLETVLPKPSQAGSQTKWKADPYAGLPYVIGRTLIAGNVVAKRGSGGSNKYEHIVTVLSVAGPIKSIEASFANRTTLNFGGGNTPSGFYNGRLYMVSQLGRVPEPAALQPAAGAFPGWTAASKLSGMAATLLTLAYDAKGNTTFTTEPAMAHILNGVFVYDPRLDSTYPGGNGACRAFDETTYVYSEDPHLHGLTLALGRYANGKRVFGIGAAMAEIDVPAFIEGANLNDARGWKAGGQIGSRPDTPWNNLKSVLQAAASVPVLVGGIISCINQAPRVSLATITKDDIAGDGDCSFSTTQPRRSRINGVIPMYRSEAHDWEYVAAAGVIVADYVALDGDERTKEIQYSLVQDVDQATQLARYDIENAREAGPGTVPLKPWWLNYRVGDCVTFSPEDDFSIKVIITGRDLDAQTGIVTYTMKSETDAKHAFALGMTGTAPPIASLTYDQNVAAPGADAWTITGTSLTSSGASIPAIEVDGEVDNSSAAQTIFELRPYAAGLGDDDNWESVSIDAPTVTRKVFASVTPGTQYQVSIRYVVRGIPSDRLILGPATAGILSTSSGAHSLNTQLPAYPITSNDTSITIAAFNGVVDDGRSIAFPAGSVTGLASGSAFYVFWNPSTSAYSAVASPALTQMANSALIWIGTQATSSSGSYPTVATPPPGHISGGCPVEDAMVLLANEARDGPGQAIRAGDIEAGRDWVWSPHENDLAGEWEAWPVVAKRLLPSEIWTADGRPDTSPSHLWAVEGGWTRMDRIGRYCRTGTVVALTIGEAHTYALVGEDGALLVSHNKVAQSTE